MNQQQEEERVQESQDADISAPQSSQIEVKSWRDTQGPAHWRIYLVVSLPSDWAKGVGLKAKDEVFMVPQTDMSLLVIPGTTGGEDSRKSN